MRTMFQRLIAILIVLSSLAPSRMHASVFGSVHGVVHDPQHRPVATSKVTLKSATSDWSQATQTDQQGEFALAAVSAGTANLKQPT